MKLYEIKLWLRLVRYYSLNFLLVDINAVIYNVFTTPTIRAVSHVFLPSPHSNTCANTWQIKSLALQHCSSLLSSFIQGLHKLL